LRRLSQAVRETAFLAIQEERYMASSLSDLDGFYYDSEDDQNRIVIFSGKYSLEYDHLTEEGTIAPTGNPDEYELTIVKGDRIGAPPYRINIVEQGGMSYQFQQDGKPFYNKTGLYEREDDPEELAEYENPEDDEVELTDAQRAGSWMDEDSVKEIISELKKKQSKADYLDYLRIVQTYQACDFSAAVPHLEKLAKHKDPEVAEAAKKTIEVIGK
jgi:hypothetical protein